MDTLLPICDSRGSGRGRLNHKPMALLQLSIYRDPFWALLIIVCSQKCTINTTLPNGVPYHDHLVQLTIKCHIIFRQTDHIRWKFYHHHRSMPTKVQTSGSSLFLEIEEKDLNANCRHTNQLASRNSYLPCRDNNSLSALSLPIQSLIWNLTFLRCATALLD